MAGGDPTLILPFAALLLSSKNIKFPVTFLPSVGFAQMAQPKLFA